MNRTLSRTLSAAVLAAGLLALAALRPAASRAARLSFHGDEPFHGSYHVPKGQRVDDVVADGPITVDGEVSGDCVSLGSSVTVNGRVTGDIASMGGPVSVRGEVGGDVASLGGSVEVAGRVGGDIASLGGSVLLLSSSVVHGEIALMGGSLTRKDGSVLNGGVSQMDLSMLKSFTRTAARYGRRGHLPELPERYSFWKELAGLIAFLAFLAGIGLLLVLLAAFLPAQVETVAGAMKADFWRSAGIGLIILMLVLPALVLLAVSILGIPLIPIAMLTFGAAVLMGLAGFSRVLSERVAAAMARPFPALFGAVAAGYGALVVLFVVGKLMRLAGGPFGFIGGTFMLANLTLLSCALLVGLGAVWDTRMGTRPAPARPLPAAKPAEPPVTPV